MANKKIYELEELTTPVSDDLLLINQSSTSKDKKVKMSNLVSNDTIESAVSNWLDDHPEATTTVEDGSITPAKLHQDTLDMFDEKADIDGYYEDMSVGSAEQLLSNTYEPDSTPYLYRTSGGSIEIGNRVYEDAIVGGSVAWNQLEPLNASKYTKTNITLSLSNREYTFTPSVSTSVPKYASMDLTVGHVYYVSGKIGSSSDTTYSRAGIINTNGTNIIAIQGHGEYTSGAFIHKVVTNEVFALRLNNATTSSESGYAKDLVISDLTIDFGSQIANYAYTLEQATAGSGIAWLKSQGFFTKDYYAYNAGGIESVKTSAKKVTGFNQWDEVTEIGGISYSSGNNTSSTSQIRSKNYIPVFPNTNYFCYANNTQNTYMFIMAYDINKNYLGAFLRDNTVTKTGQQYMSGNVFLTPSNCYYLRFCTGDAYGTTYKNDICINIHWDGERDGEYEPYVEHTYPLDSDLELRGIPKLVDGKIKYDGDTYASDGSVTRKYGIVDLGSLTWTVITSGTPNIFGSTSLASLIKLPSSSLVIPNILTPIFVTVDRDSQSSNPVNGTIGITTSGALRVASTLSGADFNSAIQGVYLIYELATATTESADPYTNPQLVDNWGTEEFVDTRNVPVPVGHNSRYLPDLKAKLESAPSNPSTNGKYFLQYQNGEATYVPVPSEVPQTPSEDGTYVLKATVSSGTATLSWVAEE